MRFMHLVIAIVTAAFSSDIQGAYNGTSKRVGAKVWVHLLAWFETKETSDNGEWGIHWTMANKNPEIVDVTGKREIAAHYYPEIGPYASGDPATIEYQLNLMKYSGVDGILLDWPGTVPAWDYPKNKENAESVIDACVRLGLEWAIVYEDHNIEMAADAGFVRQVEKIQWGQRDMLYLQNNYFNKPSYVKVDGAPLLLVSGSQTFLQPGDWDSVFSPLSRKPTFLTLWYQGGQGGSAGRGEYCWVYQDYLLGLSNFYKYRDVDIKIGTAYPGFNSFYEQGGLAGNPGWTIPVGVDTFRSTLELAVEAQVPFIQLVTWNNYGEGTMVEPTREFGNSFLNVLQETMGTPWGNEELETVKLLHKIRVSYQKNGVHNDMLDIAARHLAEFRPKEAAIILKKLS